MARGLVLDAAAVGEVERERLLAEDVLAGAQRRDDLVGVQRRRRDQEHRVEPRMREHRVVVLEHVRDAEHVTRPCALVGDRAAGGDELGAPDLPREHRRVPPAEPAQPGDADANGRSGHAASPLRANCRKATRIARRRGVLGSSPPGRGGGDRIEANRQHDDRGEAKMDREHRRQHRGDDRRAGVHAPCPRNQRLRLRREAREPVGNGMPIAKASGAMRAIEIRIRAASGSGSNQSNSAGNTAR